MRTIDLTEREARELVRLLKTQCESLTLADILWKLEDPRNFWKLEDAGERKRKVDSGEG